jgi:hypothetical protein
VYLLVFHVYIKQMHGSRSKIPSKKSRPYIYIYIYTHKYDDKFLALLGTIYIYIHDISRLRFKGLKLCISFERNYKMYSEFQINVMLSQNCTQARQISGGKCQTKAVRCSKNSQQWALPVRNVPTAAYACCAWHSRLSALQQCIEVT